MGTAHEVGAAFGVAVLAAIAASATDGYGTACLATAIAAAVLAAGAALAIPSVRPAPGHAVAVH